MAAADFKINASVQADIGFDATTAQAITLQLENAPSADVYRTVFSVVAQSKDAPDITFSPVSGEPTTPGGEVTFTTTATGFHSWRIRCQVNNGKRRTDRGEVVDPDFTKERVISIRASTTNIRKTTPAERQEYHEDGWSNTLDEWAEVVEAGAVAGVDPSEPILTNGAAPTITGAVNVQALAGTTLAIAGTTATTVAIRRDHTTRNDTQNVLTLRRSTSDASFAQANIGGQVTLELEDDGGNIETAGFLTWVYTDAAAASEDTTISLGVRTAGGAAATVADFTGTGSTLYRDGSTNNDILDLLTLRRTTSDAGFGTTGIGGRVAFVLEDGAGNADTAGTLAVDYTDATSTSEDARYLVRLQVAGSLTDVFSMRGATMRIDGLAGGGSRLVQVSNTGDVSGGTSTTTLSNALAAPVLENASSAAFASGVPIQNLATTIQFYYNGGVPATFTRAAASDNSVLEAMRVARWSTGPGAAGLGTQITLEGWSDAEDIADLGAISAALTSATGGAHAAGLGFWASTAGALVQVGTWATGATGLRLHAYGAGILHSDGSGNISSSAIVNADVDAAAAIAGTKVSPDFGAQTITNSGRVETTRVVVAPSEPTSSGSAVTFNLSTSANIHHTTTENTTVTISGGSNGQHGIIVVSQGAAGKTLTMPANGAGVEYDNTIAALTTTGIIDPTALTRTLLAYYILPTGEPYIYARSVNTIP
jgi:hypothetical protein